MSFDFLKTVAENAVTKKDMVFLCDDDNSKGLTYGQVYAISGRIYAYLEAKGIGKEDFVLVCLPRGVQPIISMLGVWRAGAAFVIVEDNYAPERIEFIKKDCGCKIVLDSDAWAEIQNYEPKEGYVEMDEHAAAYAVYTSGTTGNPKGVLHEYGNINRMILSTTLQSGIPLATSGEDRFALVAPLNFVASTLILVVAYYLGVMCYVVAYSVLKNPLKIGLFLIKNKITGMFLTPSYIRKMSSPPGSLRFCIIGSEPANDVFLEGLDIHNFYLMSESGFAVTHFLLDKRYEFTPVGNSEFGHEILLLGEDGQPVADGEEGEICFENNFVRGYMNLPEETAKVFVKDGENTIYHTGDIARKDEQGRFIICGRLNDMVKINGNRVEPGEIENVTMKVLGVDWAAARVFDNGDRVYVCAYYKEDLGEIDFETTRKKMEKYLPYYMLPSYFIKIDEVPLRPNGKMDRKALPAPDVNEYRSDYVAPRDDIEKAIVNAMEKALKLTQIGVNDDFYQLGGDSMTSMEVIQESGLSGLSSNEIFRGHTPAKIAKLYKENHINADGESVEDLNKKALEKPHRLTAEQLYMVDYQLYTPMSTMYNLFQMLKLDKEVLDIDQMAVAVEKAVKAHPALLTAFNFGEDGEMQQSYCPDLFEGVKVEKVTEAELAEIKKDLVKPFKIVNSCLFRVRLFETEEAAYLFFDVHHTLFDGTSSKVFFGDVLAAYAGEELEPDYYYYILDKRERLLDDRFYYESKGYFEGRYSNKEWSNRPDVDHENARENEDEEIFQLIPATNDELEKLDAKFRVGPNAFFITTALLATAIYNKKKDIMLSWIYNGRSDMSEMASVGLLFRNLPVALSVNKDMKLKDLYANINDQIKGAIEHSIYPYVELDSNCVSDDFECVLYQDNLREMDDIPGLLGMEEVPHNEAAAQNVLDLEILNSAEGMQLMLDYASSRYDARSIEKFGKLFNGTVRALLSFTDKADDVSILDIVKLSNKLSGFGGLFSPDRNTNWMN